MLETIQWRTISIVTVQAMLIANEQFSCQLALSKKNLKLTLTNIS